MRTEIISTLQSHVRNGDKLIDFVESILSIEQNHLDCNTALGQ
jgi:hypothetical protein